MAYGSLGFQWVIDYVSWVSYNEIEKYNSDYVHHLNPVLVTYIILSNNVRKHVLVKMLLVMYVAVECFPGLLCYFHFSIIHFLERDYYIMFCYHVNNRSLGYGVHATVSVVYSAQNRVLFMIFKLLFNI